MGNGRAEKLASLLFHSSIEVRIFFNFTCVIFDDDNRRKQLLSIVANNCCPFCIGTNCNGTLSLAQRNKQYTDHCQPTFRADYL
jgi:hypothetical protein